MKVTATKSWGPVHTNTFSKVYAFVVIENALIDWRPHYRFDAFPAVHNKTFQSDRITRCDILCWTLSACYKHTRAQRCLHLPANWYQKADFWQTDIFFLGFVLSEYAIQSHNFTNSKRFPWRRTTEWVYELIFIALPWGRAPYKWQRSL